MRLPVLAMLALSTLLYADVAGKFAGTWTSGGSGNGGELHMQFTSGGNGEWTSQSSFTIEGQEIKTQQVSVKVTGDDLEVVFAYDIQGAKLHSTMKGTLSGDKIK